MRFLDFFAGIGGFQLGMEQAGHTCVGFVEWDKFARKKLYTTQKESGLRMTLQQSQMKNSANLEERRHYLWKISMPSIQRCWKATRV